MSKELQEEAKRTTYEARKLSNQLDEVMLDLANTDKTYKLIIDKNNERIMEAKALLGIVDLAKEFRDVH